MDETFIYDADVEPDTEKWLELAEQERLEAVFVFHRRLRAPHPKTPNLRVHALMQCVVENQVALGEEIPVKSVLERLLSDGLDRHDAIHAIGSVLAGHMHNLAQGGEEPSVNEDANQPYYRELAALTAEGWRRQALEV